MKLDQQFAGVAQSIRQISEMMPFVIVAGIKEVRVPEVNFVPAGDVANGM